MSKIKQLSPLESQKIAAGEVVERPANVVKEFIENALDAGATEITLYLEEGGKKLIRVVDNGCGMSPEDARLSILHHATSKITTVDDLEHIQTYGFRGEALSSIAAVSHLTLTTKEEAMPSGISLRIEQGTIIEETIVAHNTGTDIIVADLFFNLPARKKFLKTKETEWRSISQLFYALSLAYLAVSFKVYHDERLIYDCPATEDLTTRLAQLFEPSLFKNILCIKKEEERMNLKISGAITQNSYVRFDRSQIFVFVNNRWVKNHKLVQALIKGYQGMLPSQRYPAGFLFISINPLFIDVNIHPRKEEVQFLHPRIVEDLIEHTIKEKLEERHMQQLGARPEAQSVHTEPARLAKEKKRFPNSYDEKLDFKELLNRSFAHPVEPTATDRVIIQEKENSLLQPDATRPVDQASSYVHPEFKLIGQLRATYILIETAAGLVIVDQHAAHERIIYERLRTRFEEIARVRLLFPHILHCTREDLQLFEPYLEMLLEFGIAASYISDHEIAVQETPIFLKNQSLDDLIKQAISVLHEHHYLEKKELKKIMHERIHAQISCKAAVKAGDELSIHSMAELIKDLHAIENRLTCPHGRPTLWELSSSQIEKKFKRDYR